MKVFPYIPRWMYHLNRELRPRGKLPDTTALRRPQRSSGVARARHDPANGRAIVRLGHDLPPGGALNGITRTYMSSSLRSRFRKGAALLCSWAECTTHTAHTRRGVVQRYGQPAPTRRTWVRLLPPLLGEALLYLPKTATTSRTLTTK